MKHIRPNSLATVLFLIVFVIGGCRKESNNPNLKPDFKELKIPEGFNWSAITSYTLKVDVFVDGAKTDKLDGSPLDLLDGSGARLDRLTVIDGSVEFFFRLPSGVDMVRVYSPGANRSYDIEPGAAYLEFDVSYQQLKSFGPDSDGDGIADAFDDFPNDASKAYNIAYPAVKPQNSIAYGDMNHILKQSNSLVTQTFESGSRNAEQALCWQFFSTNIVGAETISGQFSMRTGQMSSLSNTHDLISPWIEFNGSGTIDFKHKINNFSGSSKFLDVKVINYPELTETLIYTYTYSNGNLSQTVSVPVTFSGVHQIKWVFYGSGGNSRGFLDDIVISGTSVADISSNTGSGVCSVQTGGGGGGGSSSNYPGGNNYYFQIFEDLWPSRGDYDFNDMVLANRVTFNRNAQNFVVGGSVETKVMAVGASIESGIGMEFFKANSNHTQLTYFTNSVIFSGNGVAADPDVANAVRLFDNVRDWQSVPYSNTGGLGPDGAPQTISYDFTIPSGTLQHLEILVYLFRSDNPQWQVRTFGSPPTSHADMGLFGTIDDQSPLSWDWDVNSSFAFPRTGQNAFYRTENNHPWSIEFIATEFKVPFEKKSILMAYPQFRDWAESGGSVNTGWYNNPDNAHIYIPNY
jgi:LruC domain-containing protein